MEPNSFNGPYGNFLSIPVLFPFPFAYAFGSTLTLALAFPFTLAFRSHLSLSLFALNFCSQFLLSIFAPTFTPAFALLLPLPPLLLEELEYFQLSQNTRMHPHFTEKLS